MTRSLHLLFVSLLLQNVCLDKVLVGAASGTNATPPWMDLAAKLSSPDVLKVTETDNLVDDWFDQCIVPFKDRNTATAGIVHNHQLYSEKSGLCMDHAFCAYKECNAGRFLDEIYKGEVERSYDSTRLTDESWMKPEMNGWSDLDLPAAVVHPRDVRDISEAIKFAALHLIELSVKTSGHSYTGSSTKEGTLLLNLFKLKQYAHPELENFKNPINDGQDLSGKSSIVECQINDLDSSTQNGYNEACTLATARGKEAVIRVGGGETWDLVYYAVYERWNNDETKQGRKYHIVGGGAGTVSAAGGWLASGGLSGNNGMRMYGVGVDQVLHVEMVLPKGVHVRFGPTSWEDKDDMLYPQTTAVTGYCNKGDLSDESAWVWEACDVADIGEIRFADLWYAVRGGGGGAYGVVTAIYYQLHEHSALQVVISPLALIGNPEYPEFPVGEPEDLQVQGLYSKWLEFFALFFFDPEKLVNVTEADSNSCSSPAQPEMACYNGAGDVLQAAWGEFYGATDLPHSENAENMITILTFESWFHVINGDFVPYPNLLEGRGEDGPPPLIRNAIFDYIMFPLDVFTDKSKRDKLLPVLSSCYRSGLCVPGAYIMGGNIPKADDSMSSFPIHRRQGSVLINVRDSGLRKAFANLFYGVENEEKVTGDDFPGALCHNHASPDFPTPLKDDWSEACDPTWSPEVKKEKCFSYQETAWGTTILKKLERIHAIVDPKQMFNCWDCVGYHEEEEATQPSASEGEAGARMHPLVTCGLLILTSTLAAWA